MDLNEIIVFVKVAKAGSFNKAAKELDMPNSTVSAKVSSLEKRLGTALLFRTTRKISLTQVGTVFFKKCLKNIEELAGAEEEVTSAQGEPSGLLRVTAPALIASAILPEVIAAYIDKFPKVKFELLADESRIDLISDNVDVAIRVGKLEDSTLIAKKLGEGYFAAFASHEYMKKHGKLNHPKDLLGHRCIQFSLLGKEHWTFFNANRSKVDVPMTGQLLLNEIHTVKALALSGHGIALLPNIVCGEELKDKQLVRVLPEWRNDVRSVSFVYPSHKFVSLTLSSFISFAGELIKDHLKRVN